VAIQNFEVFTTHYHRGTYKTILPVYLISKCVHAIGQNRVTCRTLNSNSALTRHWCLHEYSWLSI